MIFIRRLFLLLSFVILLASVGLWISSYFVLSSINYGSRERDLSFEITHGRIYVISTAPLIGGWSLSYGEESEVDTGVRQVIHERARFNFLGFGIVTDYLQGFHGQHGWVFILPLWFPSTSALLLFLVVWRKTSGIHPKRAFEVVTRRQL